MNSTKRGTGRTQQMLELAVQATETENVVVVAANYQQAKGLFDRLRAFPTIGRAKGAEGQTLLKATSGRWIRVTLPKHVRCAWDGTWTYPGTKARVFVDHFVHEAGLL